MKKAVPLLILLVSILFLNCTRFDSFMFNASTLESYKLGNYDGELDWDSEFTIPDSLVEAITYQSDGNTIYGFLVHDSDRVTDTTILYCHGNKDHIDFYWPRVEVLAQTGYRVFIMDYRGYGRSEGSPTEEGMYEDVRQGLKWLMTHPDTGPPYITDSNTFIMYGYSLGTAPATEVATHFSKNFKQRQPDRLILESPYSSAEMLVQSGSNLALPGTYFIDLKLENAKTIESFSPPFLWLHGMEDEFLTIENHGQVVFDHYKGQKKYGYRIPGADHVTVPEVIGYGDYFKAVKSFIQDSLTLGAKMESWRNK